jgi:hypothetical protein
VTETEGTASVKQVMLFLILVFGITWSVAFWVAAQPGPTNLGGFLAAFLPQVWAPSIIALILVGASHGARGVRAEVAERLKYRRGSAPWLALAVDDALHNPWRGDSEGLHQEDRADSQGRHRPGTPHGKGSELHRRWNR